MLRDMPNFLDAVRKTRHLLANLGNMVSGFKAVVCQSMLDDNVQNCITQSSVHIFLEILHQWIRNATL